MSLGMRRYQYPDVVCQQRSEGPRARRGGFQTGSLAVVLPGFPILHDEVVVKALLVLSGDPLRWTIRNPYVESLSISAYVTTTPVF